VGAEGQQAPAVVEVPLERLRLWAGNPRRIAPERLEDLKRSLVEDRLMLQARPLVALPDGTVMLGNQRLRAARELGWASLPVLYLDLDPSRAHLWALRDNNTYGEWDQAPLAELLAELRADGVDLALAGFADRDLNRLLASLKPPLDPDQAPPLPSARPKSRPGEVYELGRHRLACGDARDKQALACLLAGEQAALLWSDPPYGVSYTGKTSARLTIENDQAEALPGLLRAALAAAATTLRPSAPFYLCAPAGPQGTVFRLALEDLGWRLHQSLVWVKQSPVLGHSDHLIIHEDILYGWTPGPGRPGRGRHRGSRWFGDNAQTSVFFFDRPAQSPDHPTQKPVGLIAAQLGNSSRYDDIVLDPFAGSGSTLIACERLGRRCFAVELDPRYCDVIRERYQQLSDA
jgi:DNA modification methylase